VNKKLQFYQKNPLAWIHDFLDDKERWSKQIEILESVRDNRNTYVKACHGVGKTHTAKDVVLWFLYNFYPATVLTTAPSWPQVEKLLWSEINHAFSNAKFPLGGSCKKTELFINDDWFSIGISPRIDTNDEGNRLTGFHNKNLLVIFDEAPACNPKLWDIKETLMTSENVKFLAIGNPVVDSGHFFDGFRSKSVNKINMNIFHSPNFTANKIKEIKDLYRFLELDYQDREKEYRKMKIPFSFLTTPRWAIERLEEWGEESPLFKSRVIGEFPTKATDTIISLASLEKCKDIEIKDNHPRILGVDVARFGEDNTVLFGYENYRQIYKQRFNGQDLVKTANLICHKLQYEKYTVVVIDDTGLGGGVTDIVRDFVVKNGLSHRVNIVAVNFAEASTQEEYDGKVTQMYFHVKSLVEAQQIQVVDKGDLFSEITSRKYNFTRKGKIKVESKDDYKKRTKRNSPDEADAFILTIWGIKFSYTDSLLESFSGRTTEKMDF
jgi:hypothetical protein